MCTPAKRLATGVDVLDLSHKSCSPDSAEINLSSQDIIVLSEDDEDKTTLTTSDTEKENAPFRKKGTDGKALLIYLENELRQEETTLLLLQKLRESQKSNSTQPSTVPAAPSPATQQNNGNLNSQSTGSPVPPANRTPPLPHLPKAVPLSLPQSNSLVAAPKFTKAAALQALEQQCNTKKAVLRKQLERNLDKITLPRPTTGTGLCEVSFIPSALTAEFTSLLGLEEVVRTIQDFDPSAQGKQPEPRRSFDPFVCVKCGTDFTPVWKREKPGSTSVICESCLASTQRSTLQKEYEESVQQVLQQHAVSEREVEHEYQDIVKNPTKLEAYIKEQEKKLLAAHQVQLAQQQQIAQQQAAVQQARYNNKQSVVNNVRTHQTTAVTTVAAHQRSRTGVATPTQSGSTQSSAAAAAVTAATTTQQLAQQYQQLAKAAAAASGTSVSGVTPASFMMAAAANTQQQRLAAAVISGLQQQAQAQQFQTSPDQFAQAVLMNNLCGGGANSPTANKLLVQQAMQYILLLQQQQQQQQQAVAAQQQAAAAAAAQAQAQQSAVLSQIFSSFQSNPTAYLSLLHQLFGGASAAATVNNANTQNKNTTKK